MSEQLVNALLFRAQGQSGPRPSGKEMRRPDLCSGSGPTFPLLGPPQAALPQNCSMGEATPLVCHVNGSYGLWLLRTLGGRLKSLNLFDGAGLGGPVQVFSVQKP